MKWVLVNVYLSLAVFRHCDRCNADPVSKDVKTSTACYGSDPKCNSHNLTCHGNSVYITIWNASYGIKNKQICNSGVADCNTYARMCCSLNKSDLFVLYNINDMQTLTGNCSDKRQCIFKAPRTIHTINGGGQKLSSYSVVRYSCLAEITRDAPVASVPVGAIVGGVVAAAVVVAVVVVIGVIWYRRQQREHAKPRADQQIPAIANQNAVTNEYAHLSGTDRVVPLYETLHQ
ncbi:uncharacterized protein LOC121372308 [Gigantopelta aegis]|uniref:uncharacterized protein LOC121372308 n=1 Tax=Gigantopelta aegis TaxID=1735272 RepID=UPI001B88CA71|nr:uncharacterized protein LOC121372308 [Gigantopelta aegis]